VIGAALVVDARREGTPSSGKLLGMGSAGALATIDIVYTAKGRISKVYLLDALLELGIVGAWACLGPELDVDTSTGA
jgi:hypothetical protein